ncbi:hypothetical protein BU15DRAFT_81671 [Melanogaster broomeanus]|nr:hypothetical protein BU15DRAFT_81671 [Melanogaster broomeanus]
MAATVGVDSAYHNTPTPSVPPRYSSTAAPPPVLTSTAAPPAVLTMPNDIVAAVPMFYGDYSNGEEPSDWFPQFYLSLPVTWTDRQIIKRFEMQLAPGKLAEIWFKSLTPSETATFEALKTAFYARWPVPKTAVYTAAQRRERIRTQVLRKEEIGTWVEGGRAANYAHVTWAEKLQRLALSMGDTTGYLIEYAVEGIPNLLKDHLTCHYTTWDELVDDIRGVPIVKLKRGREELEKQRARDVDIAQLKAHHAATSQNVAQTRSSATPYRPSPRQYQSSNLVHQNTVPYPSFRTTPSNGLPPSRAQVLERVASVPQRPNTETGIRQYETDVEAWHKANGTEAIPNLARPYPLRPGTAVAGSGECYSCGLVTEPPISAATVQRQEVPYRQQVTPVQYVAQDMPYSNVQYQPMPMLVYAVMTYEEGWTDYADSQTYGDPAVVQESSPSPPSPSSSTVHIPESVTTRPPLPPMPLPTSSLFHSPELPVRTVSSTHPTIPILESHVPKSLSLNVDNTSTESGQDRDVSSPLSNHIVTDVYMLDAAGKPQVSRTSNPFLTVPCLRGPRGECVRFLAIIDNGAMINAIDTAAYQRIARRINPLSPSDRTLRMADGSLVASTGVWSGMLEWGPIKVSTTFEVFPSGGSWRMLVGKPLLEQVQAVHNYGLDSIALPHNGSVHILRNFTSFRPLPTPSLPTAISFPSVSRFSSTPHIGQEPITVSTVTPRPPIAGTQQSKTIELPISNTSIAEDLHDIGDVFGEPPSIPADDIFTRTTAQGPFYPPRVQTIVEMVKYGNDLTQDQHQTLKDLVAEFADTFALSVKEVKPLDFATFRLNIPPGSTFSKKVGQRPLTPAQKEYLFPLLDDFNKAGLTRFIRADEVKAIVSTVLAQKTHEAASLTLDEIKSIINVQCVELGELSNPELESNTVSAPVQPTQSAKKPKWRETYGPSNNGWQATATRASSTLLQDFMLSQSRKAVNRTSVSTLRVEDMNAGVECQWVYMEPRRVSVT